MSVTRPSARIEPGRLVLVVGPSGAGKDTLIRAARERLSGDDRFVFPRRVVTRAGSDAEENESCSEDEFRQMDETGLFEIAWHAHGHEYGIPSSIKRDVEDGSSVVCNVSRGVVQELRSRYRDVLVIEVTASLEVLRERLAARGRPDDGDLDARLARSRRFASVRADVTIDNSGTLGASVAEFTAALTRARPETLRASSTAKLTRPDPSMVSRSPADRDRRRSEADRPLLVVDGDSFAHRAYHGLPKTVRRAGGGGGGAVLGFANTLIRLHAEERPRAVLVGWDTLEAPTYRNLAFPTYQAGRVFEDELVDQLRLLPAFVEACGFANAKGAGYEADDFLAAAAAREERRGGQSIVASGDRDAFQLASGMTTILHPVRGGAMARIGRAEVRERYGVDPAQVPDFIALRGDPSDKLPGARGVGPKSAASLLRQAGSLEALLASGRFAGQADELRLYRRIATMDRAAPLPPLQDQRPTWRKAASLASEWGLARLAERLDGLAAEAGPRPRPKASRAEPNRTGPLRIATFNVNNVNRRLPNLLAWLDREKPDVACLQELKAEDRAFPAAAIEAAGYRAVWCGERSWNGVAILARGAEPVLTRTELPGDPDDGQARYVEAAVRGVIVASLYLPNGNPQPGPKYAYKLAWFERLIAHAATLIAANVPVVLAGDYNVVPSDRDIYATRSYAANALLQPAPREAHRRLLAQGWTDALRHLHPDEPMFTFWDYGRERWPRDAGLRLDHLLVSPALAPRLADAGVDRWVRGEDDSSDHAPAWIALR